MLQECYPKKFTFSLPTTSFFVANYNAVTRLIDVEWTEFKVTPDDKVNCPLIAIDFKASNSKNSVVEYTFDLEKRTAVV